MFDDQQADNPAPDLQFGMFSAVFGPPDSGMQDQAIVAVNIGKHARTLQKVRVKGLQLILPSTLGMPFATESIEGIATACYRWLSRSKLYLTLATLWLGAVAQSILQPQTARQASRHVDSSLSPQHAIIPTTRLYHHNLLQATIQAAR